MSGHHTRRRMTYLLISASKCLHKPNRSPFRRAQLISQMHARAHALNWSFEHQRVREAILICDSVRPFGIRVDNAIAALWQLRKILAVVHDCYVTYLLLCR